MRSSPGFEWSYLHYIQCLSWLHWTGFHRYCWRNCTCLIYDGITNIMIRSHQVYHMVIWVVEFSSGGYQLPSWRWWIYLPSFFLTKFFDQFFWRIFLTIFLTKFFDQFFWPIFWPIFLTNFFNLFLSFRPKFVILLPIALMEMTNLLAHPMKYLMNVIA